MVDAADHAAADEVATTAVDAEEVEVVAVDEMEAWEECQACHLECP